MNRGCEHCRPCSRTHDFMARQAFRNRRAKELPGKNTKRFQSNAGKSTKTKRASSRICGFACTTQVLQSNGISRRLVPSETVQACVFGGRGKVKACLQSTVRELPWLRIRDVLCLRPSGDSPCSVAQETVQPCGMDFARAAQPATVV